MPEKSEVWRTEQSAIVLTVCSGEKFFWNVCDYTRGGYVVAKGYGCPTLKDAIADCVQGAIDYCNTEASKYLHNVTCFDLKAGGFSGNGPLTVDACWLRPSQETAGEDVFRCVLVPMQGGPAVRAVVPAHRQLLRHDGAAAATRLARASRIHHHNLTTGTCSLVSEDVHEAAPGDIGDRLCQPVILSAFPSATSAGDKISMLFGIGVER